MSCRFCFGRLGLGHLDVVGNLLLDVSSDLGGTFSFAPCFVKNARNFGGGVVWSLSADLLRHFLRRASRLGLLGKARVYVRLEV